MERSCKSLPLRRFQFVRTSHGRVTSDHAVAHGVCGSSKFCMQAAWEPSGSFPSALLDRFQPAWRSLCLPSLDLWGSSSSFLELSCSSSVHVRSPALHAFRPSSAFPGVSSHFATSVDRSNDAGSRASRHDLSRVTPVGSALSDFPSLTFCTSSTVCSALDLASLFHLAATCGFPPSGVCPSLRIGSGFLRPSPLLSLSRRACGLTRASSLFPRLQGFSPRLECGDQRGG